MSRILGGGLPTVANWLDENWLVALFGLSSHGVEFHVLQSWAREVTGGNPISLEKDMHHSVNKPFWPSPRQEVLESGAWEVSRILGTTLPTRENWLDDQWQQALFGLWSRGVRFSAFRSWSRDVALGKSITPDRPGLMEVLPNLLMDTKALEFKSRELREYVVGLDRKRFYEKEYLEDVKAHLEKYKLLYWERRDVKIVIQARLGLASGNGVPDRVRDFYDSKPQVHDRCCTVVVEGSNCKPWVMRCRNSVGAHGTKKAARMIAIIRAHIDPSFDPEGDSPPPPAYLSSRKRKRMETMNMATSSEDNEFVTLEKRLTKVEETTK